MNFGLGLSPRRERRIEKKKIPCNKMSDTEDFSEDIEGDEPRSSDGDDSEGSLRDFIVEDDEGDLRQLTMTRPMRFSRH